MIRIISGKYRHCQIEQPDNKNTRPTMDRVREAIFSSLRMNLEGKIVLDLFSGSGAMAIEAISNYASKAIAIEKNKLVYQTILKNIKKLNISNIETFNMDSISFLTTKINRVFDYIFVDPPYKEYDLLNECLYLISKNNFLDKYGYIIVECDNPTMIKIPKGFMIQKEKKYGKVYVLYLSHIN
ncbi:16S rRNA (guanine(966)-N(2))-methyltransferase RsmD [Mycoplasma tauri]|uniref:16S rRNA (Guanine(966)-N(2))-methyltransferase RsmD n=1 Tax=Mycoplasma tauri TaxID=547987 RepID=A0A953NDU5_9MOLU|nr:16S rRNA (guanine(966)-N(2))-methyltransferase RsmD [Mycoplasma tauri]MBZ4195143.1 16S rRNA (guanine(966)-N(2))-methyltransferase RsmD [Mycoplasma tauri]MBZ4203798.1 16S rRNA (guanine(966)-N(2))-methyltransferase RsmD [Mycoplasma tauri]MBZ4212418.1 16S rRNA (guanine(966)-N(2))-methyltransferase RsmD [Mycoplasma tauri]MBZ4218154.1 16S rRNA (guanine(966)-N(2))-methyltransferase RsmD [Mycoplasma tauri]QSB07758.1 16S rRNA (guanine(966)-N(2))-methyltransferase RsmD [Mycoplasma tauri]